MPYPNGASASAPRAGRNGKGQRPARRFTGDSVRADKERQTFLKANTCTREPAGTASSTTEAPTKRTKAAITAHIASLRERGRIQEPGQTVRANRVCIKGIHMKRQTHTFVSGRLMRQKVSQVCPEVSGVRTTTWGGFAAEEIVLNTAPTTFNQLVTPSRSRQRHGDGARSKLMTPDRNVVRSRVRGVLRPKPRWSKAWFRIWCFYF
jgi:hypothetical protein